MAVKKEIKFFKFPAILSAILLLASFFAWPYGYYVLLRIIATASAVYYDYYIYHMIKKLDFWFWALVGAAILFNPIAPIYLNRSMWGIIDVIAAVFFVGLLIKLNFINKYK